MSDRYMKAADVIADCDICKFSDESPMAEVCRTCGIDMKNFTPISKFDRIRSYSDEQFAEWLSSNIDCQYCLLADCSARNANDCKAIFLAWLRSPYTGGGPAV